MLRPRITLRDIAERAGVHLSTVSLALRNHPRIPEETRQRIREVARELGYEPDPMLSALALYRDRLRPKTFHGTLAWLACSEDQFDWQRSLHYSNYHTGATARARDFGYSIDIFDIKGLIEKSPKRVGSIFRARNIAGVFVCPHPAGYVGIEFPWEEFSLITFGYSATRLRLHTVASAHYRNTRQAMNQVFKRGYRRPGLVIARQSDLACDQNISAAYFVEQNHAGNSGIPIFFDLKENFGKFKPWMQKYKIDVIISPQENVKLLLPNFASLFRKTGLVNLTLPYRDEKISGIFEDGQRIGAIAAELLIAAIHRGERGIPEEPQSTLLGGFWNEGTTVCAVG